MRKNNYLILSLLLIVLTGCAGSANHVVVSVDRAGDASMDCKAIDAEIVRTQAIIDGVKLDEEDISVIDVIDAAFWFPFNLIAKEHNYNNALEAGNERLAKLYRWKKTRKCDELEALATLREKGKLTDEEYMQAKQGLVPETSYTKTSTYPRNVKGVAQGEYSHVVEQIAIETGCALVGVAEFDGGDRSNEEYRVHCRSGQSLRYVCEWGNCRLMPE